MALLHGCARPAQVPEPEYRRIVALYRQANSEAIQEARRAGERCAPASPCQWTFRLLEVQSLLYFGRRGEARPILEAPLPAGELESRRQWLLAWWLYVEGKHSEAERALDGIAPAIPDLALEVQILRGRILLAQHRNDEAERVWNAASRQPAASADPYQQARVLMNLGLLLIGEGRYDEGIAPLDRGVAAARRAGSSVLIAGNLNNLASCYANLGDFDRAIELRRQALQELGSSSVRAYRRDILGETGHTYMLQGASDRAAPAFREALAIAHEFNNAAEVWRWTMYLARSLVSLGDWTAAEQMNHAAAALAENAHHTAYTILNAAMIAAGRGDARSAEALFRKAIAAAANAPAELWAAHAGLARLYANQGDGRRAVQSFDQALAVIDQNRNQITRDEYKMTFLSRLIGVHREYVATRVSQGEWERALEVADSSRARILAERLPGQPRTIRRGSARDFQRAAAGAKSVQLSYWLAPDRSFLWIVTAGGIRHFDLPPEPEIARRVAQYRRAVEMQGRDPMESEDAAGRWLFDTLIGPVRSLIPAGSRVMLVPDGVLHHLNFETLPVYGDDRHYWLRDITVSIAPSLGIAAAAQESAARRPGPVLILGDPEYAGTGYGNLQFAAEEIERIRRRVSPVATRVIAGPRASVQSYRDSTPSGYRMVHFTAHAEANPSSPLDSAVILTKQGDRFKLYARDVQAVALDADLVTLSACRSAGARAYAGEGLVGFAWAFLQAGARRVVAGLWNVADRSTPELMDRFYAGLSSGGDPASALRAAKLAMLDGPYRRPYYWGPFQMYVR